MVCRRACVLGEHRGFTLLEALVAIAVLSLLMVLALPALMNARKEAQRVVCQSKQHQLIIAWLAYSDEYRGFPVGSEPAWRRGHSGWGGVYWFGDQPPPNGLFVTEDRPLNPSLGLPVRLTTNSDIFRCPLDRGAINCVSGICEWDQLAVGCLSEAGTSQCYGVFGTSYWANTWMYCKPADNGFGFAPVGQDPPNYRPRSGPWNVVASPSRFVVLGDMGSFQSGRMSEYARRQRDMGVGWWHGYERGQLAFLDGSVRLEKMGAVTTDRYTFFTDPSKHTFISRTTPETQ